MLTTDRPTQVVVVAADAASPADGTTVITLEVIEQIAGIQPELQSPSSGAHATKLI